MNDLSMILAVVFIVSWMITLVVNVYMFTVRERSLLKDLEDAKEENRHWVAHYAELKTKNSSLTKILREGGKVPAYVLDEQGIRMIGPREYAYLMNKENKD